MEQGRLDQPQARRSEATFLSCLRHTSYILCSRLGGCPARNIIAVGPETRGHNHNVIVVNERLLVLSIKKYCLVSTEHQYSCPDLPVQCEACPPSLVRRPRPHIPGVRCIFVSSLLRSVGRAESRSWSEFGLPALGAGSSGWNMSRPEMGKGSGDPFGSIRGNIHSTVLQQQS